MNVRAFPASHWWDRGPSGLGQAADLATLAGQYGAAVNANQSITANQAQQQKAAQAAGNFQPDCSSLWERLTSSCCSITGAVKPACSVALPSPPAPQSIPVGQPGASQYISSPAGIVPDCPSCTSWQLSNVIDVGPDSKTPGNDIYYFPQDPNQVITNTQNQLTAFYGTLAQQLPPSTGNQNQPDGTCDPTCTFPWSWVPSWMGGCVACTDTTSTLAEWGLIIFGGVLILVMVAGGRK